MRLRVLNHVVYYPSRTTNFTLWHLTDVHLGSAACNERQFQADIEAIAADPYALWGCGGDAIDGVTRQDGRYRESTLAHWLRGEDDVIAAQVHRFCKMVAPIADKCRYFTIGNHEDEVLQRQGRNAYVELVRGVADVGHQEIADLAIGWEGFINFKFRRGTPESYGGSTVLTLYVHHGSSGGRRKGADASRMEEVLATYVCDIAILGHRHKRMTFPQTVVAPVGRKVVIRERLGVWGGSYLNSYMDDDADGMPVGSYAQRKQLPPMLTSMVPIVIKPDTLSLTPILTTNGEARDIARLFTAAA